MQKIYHYRYYYICALALIACVTIISHYKISALIGTNEGFSELINVAGRQRMLSQRILSLGFQYTQSPKLNLKNDIIDSLALLLKSNNLLKEPFLKIPQKPSFYEMSMHELYFVGPSSIDSYVKRLEAHVKTLIETNSQAEQQKQLNLIAAFVNTKFLSKLDAAVSQYQRESETRIQRLDFIQGILLIIVLVTLVLEAVYIFRPMFNRMIKFIQELNKISLTDELSGLGNRRSFNEAYQNQIERAVRYNQVCTLIIIDIDHFKQINDKFGHSCGDKVIKSMGKQLTQALRNVDRCFRIGGEEFALLLPLVSLEESNQILERLREKISHIKIKSDGGELISFTASIGISEINKHNHTRVFEQADIALYKAKEGGRNKVVRYTKD